MIESSMQVDLVSQGTLIGRIRAAGYGAGPEPRRAAGRHCRVDPMRYIGSGQSVVPAGTGRHLSWLEVNK